jgi:predicted MFS family arabinose efflux permease
MMRIVHQVVLHENKSPWEQMKGGFAYTARQPDLRAFILLALFFSSFGIAFMTVMPAYVDRVLHVGAAAYGLLTSALGAGAVTGALLLATYGDRGKRGMWLFVSGMIYPVLLTIFAFTQSLPVALGLAYFLGLGFMFQFALFNTLIQTRVHDSMRGRVMSIYTLTFMGFAPFGNLAISALAEVIGLSAAITLSAAIWLTAAAAIYRWTPELKRLP